MKTVTYKSIRDSVIRRMGLDASITPLASQAAAIAEYATAALDDAWIFYPWPGVTLAEQRTPTGIPATSIAYDQPGETLIGDFLQIVSENPDDHRLLPVSFDFTTDSAGARITDPDYTAATPVWVRFRIPAPRFTTTEYSASATYAPDDIVYFDQTGDCYLCLASTTGNAPSNPAFWHRFTIPHFLGDYAQIAALADTLHEDGQFDKAAYMTARAQGILEDKQDDFWMRRDRYHHYTARFHH